VIDMWEEILKGSSRVNYPIYRQKVYEGIRNYIENSPSERVTIEDIERDKKQIIQYMRNNWSEIEDGRLAGFSQFLNHKFTGQIKTAFGKLIRDGKLENLGRVSRITTYQIIKAKDYGKVKPKKITSEMEEDIDYVTGENEYENNPTLSDKIKQILEIPYKDKDKPPKSKPDIENMDSGCGCGCDGKEVSKASSQCTKRTKKTSSTRKGKKWMACVPNGKGGYKRVHWGQRGVSVTGKRGNTKRKKSFRARHKCSTCKGGDYSARCMACRDW